MEKKVKPEARASRNLLSETSGGMIKDRDIIRAKC
jgi:hypothetical protein